MAYFGYTRVSTETQAEQGGGLNVQREKIEKYAKENGITLEEIYTDAGISGRLKEVEDDDALRRRPALMEVINRLDEGDAVIVLNTSRLWRSDTAKVSIRRQFMLRKARIISVEQPTYDIYSMNYADKFLKAVMEAADEMMRDEIALKLAAGRTSKAKKGNKPAGICPYGYSYAEDKKTVVIDETEAQTVKRMFSLAQAGESLARIAEAINATGAVTRRGKPFSKGTVREMLVNKFYTGELTHAGQPIKGNHTPIISRVQFGKVQSQLAKRKRG